MRGEAAIQRLPCDKVEHYHYSIAELEKRTGLDFGDVVRKADTYVPKGAGESRRMRRIESFDDITLTRTKSRRGTGK
jgi:endonuclease G, mitochondrial